MIAGPNPRPNWCHKCAQYHATMECPVSPYSPIPEVVAGDANLAIPPLAADVVTVGDLSSTARGTGARKSAGKPQWFQVPFWALRGGLRAYRANLVAMESDLVNLEVSPIRRLERIIDKLADWQRNYGDRNNSPLGLIDLALGETLHFLQREHMTTLDGPPPAGSAPLVPLAALKDVASVLEFGASKYPFCPKELATGQDGRPSPASAGNWAKGMPWSTAFSCAMSHLLKRAAGSVYDEESGKDHMAHVAVNLLFLSAYRDLYPEGDDRIKTFEMSPDGYDHVEDPRCPFVFGGRWRCVKGVGHKDGHSAPCSERTG